ncbi:MAG: hypothetical protein ACTSPD_01755 [Promethearchaeota archaeon]
MEEKIKKSNLSLIIFIIIAFLISSIPISSKQFIANRDEEGINSDYQKGPESSDIAGTDLYSEQISAYVAGSKSIIRQSLFTNDTNIFSHFDVNDPAFYKCNILLSASNGIQPEMFPAVLTDNIFGSQFSLSFNSFVGFLYYDQDLSPKDARARSERALEIIRRKFQIDLIMVNTSQNNLFPFVGYYPDWDVFFDEILTNLPMDGYWKALDVDRLTSKNYLENQHLSATFMLINSLDFLEEGVNITTDQINFNLGVYDLSFLENMDTQDIIDQLNSVTSNYQTLFEGFSEYMNIDIVNSTISQEDLELIQEVFGNFALANDSHYSTLFIQYEGLDQGIKKIGENKYEFNLWDALGYSKGNLSPSEKIYIALIGAFMSEIDVNILGTDIIDSTPDYFEFSDFMLEQIGLILFLTGVDFDVQSIKDYSLELIWGQEDGIFRNYVVPVNLNNSNDPVNMARQLGFSGFPFIPTGLLNPVEDLIVSYEVENSEPNMIITKDIVGKNASYGIYHTQSFNITAENVGNISVWGVPTPVPVDLRALLGDTLYEAIWAVVDSDYFYKGEYNSLEEFFNMDEDPRIFYFDTWGLGVVDHYFPDITNLTNWWPYSEEIEDIINAIDPLVLNPILTLLGMTKEDLIASFENNNSIWNKANWEMKPGEFYFYESGNVSLANYDTFSPFYSYNFTIRTTKPQLPAIILGSEAPETNVSMALRTDNESWVLLSENKYIDREDLEIDFLFKNKTKIDLVNNSLERVDIVINFTAPSNLNSLIFEVYNYSKNEFVDITQFLTSTLNNTWTFSFIDYNGTIDWLFDPFAPNNFTIIFKLKGINDIPFNFSINDLNVQFYDRDINAYEVLGSRVIYTAESGNVQHEKRSNSFTISTYNMASISAKAYLKSYSSKNGEFNVYTLDFKNIGSDYAKNITISLLIPGIIIDINNFTLKNNNLTYVLNELAPGKEKSINFSFYTPNSETVYNTKIIYYNPKEINNLNSTKLISFPNELYISAPVDYEKRYPFLRTIDIDYTSSNYSPSIGSTFNIFVHIKNCGPKGTSIPDLNLTMNDQYGDLIRIDNNKLSETNISYNEIRTFNITLRKKDWKGYYYPPINFIKSRESRTIQIKSAEPIVLGIIEFKIEKEVDRTQIEIGDIITITLTVENIGNIEIRNATLNDEISFTQVEFSLEDGKLVNKIDSLKPGESISFEYKIKAKKQASVILKEASISYFYLLLKVDKSNDIDVKIIIPVWIQLLIVIIPCIIAIAILFIFIWQINKYKENKYELQRSELMVFDLTSRESILKIEHTLRERLNLLAKQHDEQKLAQGKKKSMKSIKNRRSGQK